jgi:hypothetical protein
MKELLLETKECKGDVYCALYEIRELELVDLLKDLGLFFLDIFCFHTPSSLSWHCFSVLLKWKEVFVCVDGCERVRTGPQAHVVLANGSGKADENATYREELKEAKCEVIDRLLMKKKLGHNKFMVLADHGGKLKGVWTGRFVMGAHVARFTPRSWWRVHDVILFS